MRLRQWVALIGVMTAIGMAKVAQQTSLCLQGYALGKQAVAFHELETATQRLAATVANRQSPSALAKVMTQRRLSLVAWSELSTRPSPTQFAQLNTRAGDTP